MDLKKVGYFFSVVLVLFGLCIIFTPLRIYFLLGWVAGAVILCNGLSSLIAQFTQKKKSRSKIITGLVGTVIGVILLVSDLQQSITESFIVYLVTAGIALTGLVECGFGLLFWKKDKSALIPLVMGMISLGIAVLALANQEATSTIISAIVGFYVMKMGASVFVFTKDYDKPRVI